MTVTEAALARAICERLFGSFMASELGSPSSVSAQCLVAARDVLQILESSLIETDPKVKA